MGGFSNWLSQLGAVTKLSMQTILERKGSSTSAAFGIAGVVFVLVFVLSIGRGFKRTLTVGGSPDAAIVLRSGSDSEMMSGLGREDVRVVSDTPGIARSANGALASGELFVIISLPKRSTGTDANVPFRGVESAAFDVRRDLRIIEGRRFEAGKNEIIAGAAAARQFARLDLGNKFRIGPDEWTVVGIFSAKGGITESEIWTDAGVLQPAYRRGDSFQSVHLKLSSADEFGKVKGRLTTDPRLNVKVVRESEYYAEQSEGMSNLIMFLGVPVALMMGVGAAFGALNTMYTAVAARTREIATLRALGFGRSPVVISVLIESACLAFIGGAFGGAMAYFAFDGYRTATLNWQTFSQVAFAFDVTPTLLALGIVYAALIGLVGGLFPAIRAARLPIATALRGL